MANEHRLNPAANTDADQAAGNTRLRFEQWAQNPTCEANAVSVVHNVKMSEVAARDGVDSSFGQSPFALARGVTFERELLKSQGKLLIEGLIGAGVLPVNASGLTDVRTRLNGGPLATLALAANQTAELVRSLAANPTMSAPALVAGATVRIPRRVMLPEAVLILDIMAIRTDGDLPELIVGEIKTYPDRGGHTDPQSIALARAQAGIYVHALQLLVRELGIEERIRVATSGFLVLTKPGSNRPSIRAGEELRFQAERALRGFDLLEQAARGLPPFHAVDGDPIRTVQ